MLNSELYDLILVKARRVNDTQLRTVIPAELRQMLQSLEHSPFHPWFLETTSSGLTTTVDVDTLDAPEDYLLLVEDTKVWITDSEGTRTRLVRRFHEDIEEAYNGVSSGRPESFDIFRELIYLGPIPNDIYTIGMKYYAKTIPPPDNDLNVSNPWVLEAEDFFITEIARRLQVNYIKDMKVAGELSNTSALLRSELHKYNESRKHVEMDYTVDR